MTNINITHTFAIISFICFVIVILIIIILFLPPKKGTIGNMKMVKPGPKQTAPPPPAPIPQHDSISLQGQLMRLNAEHAHWTNVFFIYLEKMKRTASMDDYMVYSKECNNAQTRVKRLDDQIIYLKRALSDVHRTVGNYETKPIKTMPLTDLGTKIN